METTVLRKKIAQYSSFFVKTLIGYMDDFISKKIQDSSTGIYHDYGYFVVEFEQMVLSIQLNIYTIFSLQGLKDLTGLKILLHDQTAYPLNAKLRSLVYVHYDGQPEKQKMIDELFVKTNTLIEKRNFVIHGSSFISRGTSSEILKNKIGKTGLKVEQQFFDKAQLSELTSKIINTKDKFDILNLCLMEPHRDIEKYFSKERLNELEF